MRCASERAQGTATLQGAVVTWVSVAAGVKNVLFCYQPLVPTSKLPFWIRLVGSGCASRNCLKARGLVSDSVVAPDFCCQAVKPSCSMVVAALVCPSSVASTPRWLKKRLFNTWLPLMVLSPYPFTFAPCAAMKEAWDTLTTVLLEMVLKRARCR